MKRAILISALLLLVGSSTAWPIDQIFMNIENPKEKGTFLKHNGKILNMSATVIAFEPQKKDGPTEIQVNEINRIIFDNSPTSLTSAQKAMLDGDYEQAIHALEKEETADKGREVSEEIQFCRAYCAAQLALSGGGESANPAGAGKQLFNFIEHCPNSFHFYKANELLGDICVATGKFANAQKYYANLSQAPWPDYKIRAQVALGRSYLAQDNAAAAHAAFSEALKNDASGPLAELQRTAARIGEARCLVLGGKTKEAMDSLNDIIEQTEERNPEVMAMAYNALGTALRKSGKPKEAINAFLHVRLSYYTQPDLDAEACADLETLFTETHKPDHAHEMRDILDERYKNSRWAKGVK